MTIDKKFVDLFHRISSEAAISTFNWIGKKDKNAADKAAVDSMRNNLNKINMKGKIVIGEGELDKAPMLYLGEKLGTENGPELDIAVDPLEGTNFAANNLPGALSVIAVAEKSNLFSAPETYMDKIAVSSPEKGIVDLDFTITLANASGNAADAVMFCWYDANDAAAVFSYIIDSDSAGGTKSFIAGSANASIVDLAMVYMNTADFTALDLTDDYTGIA